MDRHVRKLLQLLDEQIGDYDRFSLDLVLRETLNNAVIHGNRSDPDLNVQLSLIAVEGEFQVQVEDQGAGFDWRTSLAADADPDAEHGRGLPIIQYYCHSIHFNETGNQICYTIPQQKGEPNDG